MLDLEHLTPSAALSHHVALHSEPVVTSLCPAAGRASQARLIEEADGPDPSKQVGLPGEGPEQENTLNTFLGQTCGSLVCMNNL